MDRWVLRVAAYVALMTDSYPPFRLDLGGPSRRRSPSHRTGRLCCPAPRRRRPGVGSGDPVTPGSSGGSWSAGPTVAVVAGSVLLLLGVGAAASGAAAFAVDRAARDADWFLNTGARGFTSSGYALVFDPIELHGSRPAAGPFAVDLDAVQGDVRVRATAAGPGAFVGIGPADAVAGYLAAVDRERVVDLSSGRAMQQRLPGGAPATPPAQQTFWVASAAGPRTSVGLDACACTETAARRRRRNRRKSRPGGPKYPRTEVASRCRRAAPTGSLEARPRPPSGLSTYCRSSERQA